MSEPQLQLELPAFTNRGLFADHYLENRLPGLAERKAEHKRLTAQIVALETELNDRVYRLFDLTPEEIRIIEESTKYRYGEV
ncbi:MAG: hypothetical protein HY320_00890 [Armatimonadetes bacterium]|nr:hypothetical protein [Armatimonadota bacterium]